MKALFETGAKRQICVYKVVLTGRPVVSKKQTLQIEEKTSSHLNEVPVSLCSVK
jgi:hypothetical protein